MTMPNCSSLSLLGTQLSLCDQNQLFEFVQYTINQDEKVLITSGNVHAFNLAYRTPWLQAFMNEADIVRIDGAGVRLGAKLLGHDTPPRMTWADFGWDLATYCETNGHSLFLLGTQKAILEKAVDKLMQKHPHLNIVGVHHGFFDKTHGSAENNAVLELIQEAQPDILLVGFGMPRQEHWIKENYDHLPVHVIFTVGAAFDYISGELRRAPTWMTDHGLEWLGRMLIEPKRLWRRYVIGNPLFIFRVLVQRFGKLR